MFQRGVVVLVLAAMLTMLASDTQAETRNVNVISHLKNPVVKSVFADHGKIKILLKEDDDEDSEEDEDDEGDDEDSEAAEDKKALKKLLKKVARKQDDDRADDFEDDGEGEDDEEDDDEPEKKKVQKKKKQAPRKQDDEDEDEGEGEGDEDDEDEEDDDEPEKKKVQKKKKQAPRKQDDEDDEDEDDEDEPEKKKVHKKATKSHKKQVSTVKNAKGEIVTTYPHGTVRIVAKQTPSKKAKKAHKKQAAPAPAAAANETKANSTVLTRDVDLNAGESVVLEFDRYKLNLTVAHNGSLLVNDGKTTFALPKADQIEVQVAGDFDGVEEIKDAANATTAAASATTVPPAAPSLLHEVKSHIDLATKKFSEFATTMMGSSVSKDVAPVVAVCGLIGALAAVIGVAAIAVGRVRHGDAAEDPQSVLADAAVEDVEAGIQAKDAEDESTDDAPVSKADSLSDSESDSEMEEGTFANDKAASV